MVLRVKVLDPPRGVVQLGRRHLVVPQFYGLSNPIDDSVLNIRVDADLVCTVRLITTDISVPALGQLVREEDATQRKGTEHLNMKRMTLLKG